MVRSNRDLWAVVALAGLGVAVQWPWAPAGVRIAAGLAFVALCPGYALSAALFPGRRLGWSEWSLFSLGLSMATAILGAIALNESGLGLSTGVSAGLFAAVTMGASLVAARRRRGHAGDLSDEAPARWPLHKSSWPQWTLLGLAALLTISAVTVARTSLTPTGVVGYTLLSITPVGDASSTSIALAMSSSELSTTHYRLQVTLDGRLFLAVPDIALEPGEKWGREVTLPGGQVVRLVEADLFRLDAPGTVYRRVSLYRGAPGT